MTAGQLSRIFFWHVKLGKRRRPEIDPGGVIPAPHGARGRLQRQPEVIEPHGAPQSPPLGAGSRRINETSNNTLEVEESSPFKARILQFTSPGFPIRTS